jgi:hypothetical protein
VIVGFTGTRAGMTAAQLDSVRHVLAEFTGPNVTLMGHHGDCIGADAQFHALLKEINATIVVHPPDDPKHRAYCNGGLSVVMPARPYLQRNRSIANASSILLAAPKETEEPAPGRGQGTWSTVRYARKVGIPNMIIWTDGSTTE